MSVYVACDLCGENIDGERVVLEIRRTDRIDRETLGDYHDDCWHHVWDTVRLAEEYHGTIERIPVATGQSIAAKRRKHTQSGQES
jgi:hypothetical protein